MLKTSLSTPLPRAYDCTQSGGSAPYGTGPQLLLGGNAVADPEALSAVGADLRRRVEEEVIAPLEAWLAVYRSIKV